LWLKPISSSSDDQAVHGEVGRDAEDELEMVGDSVAVVGCREFTTE